MYAEEATEGDKGKMQQSPGTVEAACDESWLVSRPTAMKVE